MIARAWPERAGAEPSQDFGYLFVRACGPGLPNEMNCTLPVYIFGQVPRAADPDKYQLRMFAANLVLKLPARSLVKNYARLD